MLRLRPLLRVDVANVMTFSLRLGIARLYVSKRCQCPRGDTLRERDWFQVRYAESTQRCKCNGEDMAFAAFFFFFASGASALLFAVEDSDKHVFTSPGRRGRRIGGQDVS